MASTLIYRDGWLNRRTQRFDLYNENGQLYLSRWTLYRSPRGKKLMLHRMSGPDGDRFPHDHPWKFTSFVLWGGYTEQVLEETLVPMKPMKSAVRTHGWLSTHHIPATGLWHKILRLRRTPTWTLIWTGEYERTWGFMTQRGWVPYYELKEPVARSSKMALLDLRK